MTPRLWARQIEALVLDQVSRDWGTVATGNLARLGFGFIASVLVARGLGPADFGIFAILGAIGNVVGALADLGLTDAAVNRIAKVWPTDRKTAAERARVFVLLRLGATAVVVMAGSLISELIPPALLPRPDLRSLALLTMLGVAATALSGTIAALLQATKEFGRLTVIGLTNATLTALLAAALVSVGRLNLVTALVVLGIGTSLASAVIGWRLLPVGMRPRLANRSAVRAEGGELIRLARWLGISNVFAMLTAQLDLLLLSHWYAAPTVGAYALAVNLATKVDVVNSSLYTVLLPTVSSLADRAAVRAYVRRCVLRSALIGLAIVPAIFLIGPFVTLFYGSAYLPTIPLFQRLLAVVIFDVFATPLLLLAYHFNRPRLLAGADVIRAGVLAGVGAILIPGSGPNGAIAAKLAAKIVGAAGSAVLLTRQQPARPSGVAPAQKTDPS